ncbi:hypothetical protein, partial [Klebsiella pneumoniae]|uniref:hypothetical protein n=1 Tax=Klebsiella pneumoniae TaxID=573 RepID=UPI0027310ACF
PERVFDIKKVKLTYKPRYFGIASWTVIHPFSAIRIEKTPPKRGFCVKGETDRKAGFCRGQSFI